MKHAERKEITRTALLDAVLTLQQQRTNQSDPPPITISDICREANLTRPTFYQYFESADAAIAAACSQQLVNYFQASDSRHASESQTMKLWMNLLRSDVLLQSALTEGGAATRRAAVAAIADRLYQRWNITDDPTLKWRAQFAAAGMFSVISLWLHEDQPAESGEEIIELVTNLARAVKNSASGGTSN